MNLPLDITGQRYGRLVALHRDASRGRRTAWVFQCDCGIICSRGLEGIRGKMTESCGCLRRDTTRDRSLTHGHTVNRLGSRTYRAYGHAKARCYNPHDEKFPQYGGRGIQMNEEWADDFAAFLRDMGECPPKLTLERIDVNGHYEPGNCRWATSYDQSRNRTDNVFVEHNGQRMVLKDYAAAVGVNYKALHVRYRTQGQKLEEAVAALRR